MKVAMPICRRLFTQYVCLDFSLARDNAGRSIAARIAMMAITTRSSINVKPRLGRAEASWQAGPGSGMRVLRARLLPKAWRVALFEFMVVELILTGYVVSAWDARSAGRVISIQCSRNTKDLKCK